MLREGTNHRRRLRFMTSHAMLSHCILPSRPGRQIINKRGQYFDSGTLQVLTPCPLSPSSVSKCQCGCVQPQYWCVVSCVLAELTPQYTVTVVKLSCLNIGPCLLVVFVTLKKTGCCFSAYRYPTLPP